MWAYRYMREMYVQRTSCTSSVLPKEVLHIRVERGEKWDSDLILWVAEGPLKGVRQVDLYSVKNSPLPVLRLNRGKEGTD